MNCAVCSTPRNENEDSCLFCGAKFPELNSDQENENYKDNGVVSFGVENYDTETLDIEDFDFSIDDFNELEKKVEDLELEEETGVQNDFSFLNEVPIDNELSSVEEQVFKKEELDLVKEEIFEEGFNLLEENTAEKESELIEEDIFTEAELEFLNNRVEEVYNTVEKTIDESSRSSKKNTIEEEFDLSLEDLENIEKGLNMSSDTLSMLEEALLSGEDITSFDVKEAIAVQNQTFEEVELTKKSLFEDEMQINDLENPLDKNEKIEEYGIISFEMFEKVRDAIKAREKGETLDYIIPITDNRSDDEILRDVQGTVNSLINEKSSSSEDLSEELLELEQMLLAKGKEEAPRVIEDIEDVEDLDFVDVEEIDDDDNLFKPSVGDDIQQGIDDIVKNFREKISKPVEEQEEVQEVIDEPIEENIEVDEPVEENEEDLDELELIDREILKAKKIKEEAEERAAKMGEIDSNLKELDSLILDVIGDLPDLDTAAKAKTQVIEAEEMPVVAAPESVMEKPLYDKELVKEYEALRLDLELFFPGTQELDRLNDDIDDLLKEDDISELFEQTDLDYDVNFEGFDFEELTDKDISDALIDLRDSQENIDRKRIEERRKKRNARRKKINSIITLGNRVRAYDTALLVVCIITSIVLAFAWMSTVRTRNLTVNMLTRSEQEEVVDKLWKGLYDIATKYDNIQESLEGYTRDEVDTNKVTFELNNLIDETIIARQQFEAIDLPTYSQYKYKIDEFLAKRMLLSEEVLEDVIEGKKESDAITEFLIIETDFAAFEESREEFNKQLNLSN